MARFTLLLICGLIPSLLAYCDVKNVELRTAKSVYNFSVNLLTRLAQKNDNHFVVSTLSTWILLAHLSLGASSLTLKEMKKVLKLDRRQCVYEQSIKVANTIKSYKDSAVLLEGSSYIFASDKKEILENFITKLSAVGFNEFLSLPFEETIKTAQTINNYTDIATHGTIKEIVTPDDFLDTLIIMIDTINFKGSWDLPFPEKKTRVAPFYDENGEEIGLVNLMQLSTSLLHSKYLKRIQASVLELPYGDSKKYSMLIFLPDDEVSLANVIQNLKLLSLNSMINSLEKLEEEEIEVELPRFKIASDLKLKDILMDMGLQKIFGAEAQFPFISDDLLYVTDMFQKATIEVTEQGTIASAVTKLELGFRTYPSEFIVNRPFIFMIIDRQMRVPLFTGAYSKPSLF